MGFSLIIPSHGQATRLYDCVQSSLRFNELEEIIIVHSGGQSIDQKIPQDSRIKVQLEERNLKAGEARNLGASLSNRPHLIFLDSDCFWNESWVDELKGCKDFPDKLWALNGAVHFEAPQNSWAFALHIFEFHEFLSQKPFRPRFLHSGNLVISKNAFQKSEGFREDIPMCTDFTFTRNFEESDRSHFQFLPKLAITHSLQISDEESIKSKVHQMGYWRGYVESSIQNELKLSKRWYFPILTTNLGLTFLIAQGFRLFKRDSLYQNDFLQLRSKLFILSQYWAKGFDQGLRAS